VIFGANGDLTKRKLLPALYRLPLALVSATACRSRRFLTIFSEKMRESVEQFSEDTKLDDEVWAGFARGLFYVAGDIGDPGLYQRLGEKLGQIESERHTGGNALFYLSTQPSQYAPIAHGIGAAGMGKGNGWRRLVVEKPFGHDLASARELSNRLHEVFDETDVYRIDHYLGKETVQNILAFRFGNGIFEPLWNRRYVNHVQITGAESIGVEGRGAYYQEAGALDDMIQNHLLQVMATIAMEPSASFQATSVRDERSKLLRSIRPMTADEVRQNTVAGQYGPASIGGKDVPGFRQEEGVDPNSQTNTYAAVTFFVDNWRWAGVSFYVRTGKRLAKRVVRSRSSFKLAPLHLFNQDSARRASTC
jgi:glucose-6-phosphate 1-dehydrogenase